MFGEPVKKVLTYDVEAHGQLGRWNGAPHRAWAFASLVRAQLPKPRMHPGVHLGYAMGSGNACTGEPGTTCSQSSVLKHQRLIFWIVALVLLALLSVPWLAPLFL